MRSTGCPAMPCSRSSREATTRVVISPRISPSTTSAHAKSTRTAKSASDAPSAVSRSPNSIRSATTRRRSRSSRTPRHPIQRRARRRRRTGRRPGRDRCHGRDARALSLDDLFTIRFVVSAPGSLGDEQRLIHERVNRDLGRQARRRLRHRRRRHHDRRVDPRRWGRRLVGLDHRGGDRCARRDRSGRRSC